MKKLLKRKKTEPIKAVEPSLDSFPNFTKKEIFTQSDLIYDLVDRLVKNDKISLDYLKIKADRIKRVYIIGAGINYPATIFGAYNFEVLLDVISVGMPMGEFLSSNPIIDKSTLVVMLGENEKAEKRVADCQGILVKIVDFSNAKNTISLNYKTMGEFDTASFNLKLIALSLLALYLGEKNKVITELYTKIAVTLMRGLKDKIADVLSKEFVINEIANSLDFSSLCLVGTNVDYGVALYGSYLFGAVSDKPALAYHLSQLPKQSRKNNSIIALASCEELYDLINFDVDCRLKIITNSIEDKSENVFAFDESIPLLNPILCAVALQLIAYSKYMSNEQNDKEE